MGKERVSSHKNLKPREPAWGKWERGDFGKRHIKGEEKEENYEERQGKKHWWV